MDSIFPFNLPGPTALYLVLYMATFALHQALMHYVLAGSSYVAGATLLPGSERTSRGDGPLATTIRDWMPFMLSAAITAGVAPLLFIQIVYRKQFYTANLLLGWRWMVVIPVLVVAFYLLYLLKSRWLTRRSAWLRTAVPLGVVASFIFVGFCWTANHMLANAEASWPDVYVTGQIGLEPVIVGTRILAWFGAAFTSLAVIAGWQLGGRARGVDSEQIAGEGSLDRDFRRLGWIATIGLLIALAAAVAFLIVSPEPNRRAVLAEGRPYLWAVGVGSVLQLVAWARQMSVGRRRSWLIVATAGWGLALLGASVLREQVRLASIDMQQAYDLHASAADVGGMSVFLFFAAVNFVLIGFCVWLVRRGLAQAD